MTGQKPVAKYHAGQVSAAIWENEISVNGRQVTVLKATVQRRYKDKDGDWKSSGSFSRNEIPLTGRNDLRILIFNLIGFDFFFYGLTMYIWFPDIYSIL